QAALKQEARDPVAGGALLSTGRASDKNGCVGHVSRWTAAPAPGSFLRPKQNTPRSRRERHQGKPRDAGFRRELTTQFSSGAGRRDFITRKAVMPAPVRLYVHFHIAARYASAKSRGGLSVR